MKTETRLDVQLHIEGYSRDIFNALHKPELKNQYESYLGNNTPMFEDEPDYRVGSIPIDSMESLLKTIQALNGVAKTMALYISGGSKETGVEFDAFIGDGNGSPTSYKSGGEIKINESVLTEGIRTAAKNAYKTLGDALGIRTDEVNP